MIKHLCLLTDSCIRLSWSSWPFFTARDAMQSEICARSNSLCHTHVFVAPLWLPVIFCAVMEYFGLHWNYRCCNNYQTVTVLVRHLRIEWPLFCVKATS